MIVAIPKDGYEDTKGNDDEEDMDQRITESYRDKRISRDNEYSDSEDEDDRRDEKNNKDIVEGNVKYTDSLLVDMTKHDYIVPENSHPSESVLLADEEIEMDVDEE